MFTEHVGGQQLIPRRVFADEGRQMVASLEMKSAANVSHHLRQLDEKVAIKKVPVEPSLSLNQVDATNSCMRTFCQPVAA